jgi:HTH-type transcriptional regulator / antitoxin HipB
MPRRQIATAGDLGAAILAARKKQGLTQRQLALAAGTGERFVVELENGKGTARLGTALRVAATLGLRLETAGED